jgi:hypothetical protein
MLRPYEPARSSGGAAVDKVIFAVLLLFVRDSG